MTLLVTLQALSNGDLLIEKIKTEKQKFCVKKTKSP